MVRLTSTDTEELYSSVAPIISKLLWTLLGPDPERDDLAHEIFLRILQNAHQLPSDEPVPRASTVSWA